MQTASRVLLAAGSDATFAAVMVDFMTDRPRREDRATLKAVLGPTNTGKTHLAIERLCAHSSGAIGFPLRLLAREVYDRVCAIKGDSQVALITGEERIEPPGARWLLCTAEAMPVTRDELAFVALDEAQLAGDRERGHIFTDRLLHARGREETMILGSATLAPMLRTLLPETEFIERPRFSTLSHAGVSKLSRIPPRSAIVAFSAGQVYAIAEMLRRFRGGAAVVMGALSPSTRNAQVELYMSGEVDYLVATDAVGMGLNLDVDHVVFASLAKFDGVRHRRLAPAEMAQIAGRAGRHQRDGTFGTLAGTGDKASAFTDEEVHAIEEHRFAPLTKLFWREAEPRFDTIDTLIADLEARPQEDGLVPAPEAIDLAVLKRLADTPEITDSISTESSVARLWEACSLPDFRQQGAETHAQFVMRLWQHLRGGELPGDFVASAIANLDNVQGDIDTLQGRIAAIRSWAYIAQRPDWVLAKGEMAARATRVEARLSDALHARLKERFINRRTAVLMKRAGPGGGMLSVDLDEDDVLIEGERIGTLRGFTFRVDPDARHTDRRLLLATADKHVPGLVSQRAIELASRIEAGEAMIEIRKREVHCGGHLVARIEGGRSLLQPELRLDRALDAASGRARQELETVLGGWLTGWLKPIAPLNRLAQASVSAEAGPELRALLIRLCEAGGILARKDSSIDKLDKAQRAQLSKLGVRVGALDLFVPAMVKRAALAVWHALPKPGAGNGRFPQPAPEMQPVLPAKGKTRPPGYRQFGKQWLRIDMAEKLLREAHAMRATHGRNPFRIDHAKAVSMGLTVQSHEQLLRLGGFKANIPKPMRKGAYGPPAPVRWRWKPTRRPPAKVRANTPRRDNSGAFAALAELVQ